MTGFVPGRNAENKTYKYVMGRGRCNSYDVR
ncbi:hypothetical protein SAMN05428949_6805 [Chitinophaga sp. YR627]|nr:hypothetical protein SAMN05428949_6805 [Chitinophaga sp. YR627]